MERQMYKFLDHLNPNIFLLETKFGIIPRYGIKGDYVIGEVKRKHIKMLCNFFSSDLDYCTDVYEQWLDSKPVCVRLKNSTNEDTFVVESDLMIAPTTLS